MTHRVWFAIALGALLAAAAFTAPAFGGMRPSADAGAPHAKWLYLLYLDADNSLDANAGAHHVPVVQSDLDELMSVGSSPDVVAFVLVDRFAGPSSLYRVERGALVEQTGFTLDGKEANMGDPATLRGFVTYTTGAVAADHILLTFWDHGSPNYVAFDEHATTSGGSDRLTHQEVVQALEGVHVDVIAADECQVGQLEVAYEYVARGLQVDYLVAAETYTGWRGFPYDWTLQALVDRPDMTGRDAAVMIVQETQRLLGVPPYSGEEVNSHTAIDLGRIRTLGASVLDLARLLMSDMKTNAGLVSKARGAGVFSYGANAANLVDLKTFALRVAAGTRSAEIQSACAVVAANVDAAVLGLHATRTTDHQLYGIGIALPNHEKEVPGYYANFAFPAVGWMSFLSAYWAASGAV